MEGLATRDQRSDPLIASEEQRSQPFQDAL
jgi:hypothetical protein